MVRDPKICTVFPGGCVAFAEPAGEAVRVTTVKHVLQTPNAMVVELNTPRGSVFSGHADDAELRTTDGVITIQPAKQSYLNLTETTQITLRVGTEFITYVLRNAAASLREGRLTVLAEDIRRVDEPEPISKPAFSSRQSLLGAPDTPIFPPQ